MQKVLAVDLKTLAPTTAFNSFSDFVNIIVKNAVVLAGVISFLLLVFGGFGVIMGAGAGDSKKTEQGKKTITGAVLGFIIVITSVWIVQILEKISGISLLGTK
jgi:hypothetical protein